MQFIPRSVLMRSKGFVRNPRAKFMEDPWVVRPVIRDTSREDKVIAIFERFLAQWLKQSRRAREQSALKERTRRILERTVMVRDEDPEWTSVMRPTSTRTSTSLRGSLWRSSTPMRAT